MHACVHVDCTTAEHSRKQSTFDATADAPADRHQLRPARHEAGVALNAHEGLRHEAFGRQVAGGDRHAVAAAQAQAAQQGFRP